MMNNSRVTSPHSDNGHGDRLWQISTLLYDNQHIRRKEDVLQGASGGVCWWVVVNAQFASVPLPRYLHVVPYKPVCTQR